MSMVKYELQMKDGRKYVKQLEAAGLPTELPVLDRIIENVNIKEEVPLGLIDIPLDMIAGTKTEGRSNCFDPEWRPILGTETEFAFKWASLAIAHQEEGIRDPIKAYEYLNKYYVLEGNKRVSVLKHFEADSIPAYVYRLVPEWQDTPEIRLYYEFLEFYKDTNIAYLTFSKEGSYEKLANLLGHSKRSRWTHDQRFEFRSLYNRFSAAFEALGGKETKLTVGDALLQYLTTFAVRDFSDIDQDNLEENLKKAWNNIVASTVDPVHAVMFDPAPEQKKSILTSVFKGNKDTKLTKIAFIYKETSETNAWTYAHELGRLHIEDAFNGQIQTTVYDGMFAFDDFEGVIEQAVEDGNEMIFVTAPEALPYSVAVSVNHPDVKILNCSLNSLNASIRTYYGRLFEAKFLSGILAGVLTDTDKVGYIAEVPIIGELANINAFARGVKMVNPRAKVYLEWGTDVKNQGINLIDQLYKDDITYISLQTGIQPQGNNRHFGMVHVTDEGIENLALAVWDWGKYYELIIKSVQNGSWSTNKSGEEGAIVSYWWGMSSEVIDIILSEKVPTEARILVETLRKSICSYELTPFDGVLTAQDGTTYEFPRGRLEAKEVVFMDKLENNIIGHIPTLEELIPITHPLVKEEGILKQ